MNFEKFCNKFECTLFTPSTSNLIKTYFSTFFNLGIYTLILLNSSQISLETLFIKGEKILKAKKSIYNDVRFDNNIIIRFYNKIENNLQKA